jgi:hypothetical protein
MPSARALALRVEPRSRVSLGLRPTNDRYRKVPAMSSTRAQLTEEHFEFLKLLATLERGGVLATRRWLPLATRKQDRIRQQCRAAGVATWRYGYWALTGQGIALLKARGGEARSAETALAGSVHEHPVGEADAPENGS